MSAGDFISATYISNAGTSYPCRVQPETLALELGGTANATGAVEAAANTPTLTLRKGRRARGLVPRTVTVKFTAAPAGEVADYSGVGSVHTIPVMTEAAWDSYGPLGQAGTYLGTACEFVSKAPELVR